jgi:hypothetical protein
MGGADNFMYEQEGTDTTNAFTLPILAPVINVGIDGEFSTFSTYGLKFEKDPILRYLASGNMTFNLWTFRLGVGAFMSMFNTNGEEYLPGVNGSVGLEIPGILSVYVEYGLSVNPGESEPANVNLNYGKVEAAVWLPGMICRLVVQRKSFTMTPIDTYTVKDSLLRYQVSLDFFSKSSTFRFALGGGTETLERAIEPIAGSIVQPQKDAFDTTFVMASISSTLNPGFEFLLNIDVPLSPAATGFFFKAIAGFRIAIPDF